MSDSVPLITSNLTTNKLKRCKSKKEKLEPTHESMKDADDINGMIINALSSINWLEMVIIWVWYLMIHSDLFVDQVLSNLPGDYVDEHKNFTISGTVASSFIMIVGVIIIDMIFR